MHEDLIDHQDSLPKYGPPAHRGTTNVRLVEKGFGGGFELVHGTVEPGGEAERHSHETEHQVIYVLDGAMTVELGEDAPVACGRGAIVRIPPGLDHRVVSTGERPLAVIIVYCPPLPARADVTLAE